MYRSLLLDSKFRFHSTLISFGNREIIIDCATIIHALGFITKKQNEIYHSVFDFICLLIVYTLSNPNTLGAKVALSPIPTAACFISSGTSPQNRNSSGIAISNKLLKCPAAVVPK